MFPQTKESKNDFKRKKKDGNKLIIFLKNIFFFLFYLFSIKTCSVSFLDCLRRGINKVPPRISLNNKKRMYFKKKEKILPVPLF